MNPANISSSKLRSEIRTVEKCSFVRLLTQLASFASEGRQFCIQTGALTSIWQNKIVPLNVWFIFPAKFRSKTSRWILSCKCRTIFVTQVGTCTWRKLQMRNCLTNCWGCVFCQSSLKFVCANGGFVWPSQLEMKLVFFYHFRVFETDIIFISENPASRQVAPFSRISKRRTTLCAKMDYF